MCAGCGLARLCGGGGRPSCRGALMMSELEGAHAYAGAVRCDSKSSLAGCRTVGSA